MATQYVQEVGLSDFSEYDTKGQKNEKKIFPFSLTFKPGVSTHKLFPKDMVNNDPMAYVGQLETVPANYVLYDVYALDKPTEMGGK